MMILKEFILIACQAQFCTLWQFLLSSAKPQGSGDCMESLHSNNDLREWVPSTPCSLSPSYTYLYSSFLLHSSTPDLLPLRLDSLLTSLCHSTCSQFPLTAYCLLSPHPHQTFSLLFQVQARLIFIHPRLSPCSLALYSQEERPCSHSCQLCSTARASNK